jgi:hypothetical protein
MPASQNGLFTPVYCSGCGEHTELSYTTKRHQYCSKACKQKAYRDRKGRASRKIGVDVETVKRWHKHGLGCFTDELFDYYDKFGEEATNHCVGMMIKFLYTTGIARGHVPMPDDKLTEVALRELAKRYG